MLKKMSKSEEDGQNKGFKRHITRLSYYISTLYAYASYRWNQRFFEYICSMKTRLIIIILLTLGLISCSRSEKKLYMSLDQAIERQGDYDRIFYQTRDSLFRNYMLAPTDSCRWEAAYKLEKILYYHNIDSCHYYVRRMLDLHGNDIRQKNISQSCYAYILYKMDSLKTALQVFRQIDTTDLNGESKHLYCDAGYHIYSGLITTQPEFIESRKEIIDYWWKNDSTSLQCVFYHNKILREEGRGDEAIEKLKSCPTSTPNDTARLYYFIANEHLYMGNTKQAINYFTQSAAYDMKLSAKAYNALYQLARILFREGDIERADRYMRITLNDARISQYRSRYEDVIHTQMEIMNALLHKQKQKQQAYFLTAVAILMMLIAALISLILLNKYSSWLRTSREKLSEVSKIKDSFLAIYMEKCVDYLNKVDKYRSSLRQAVKQEGPEAAIAMLRHPSFADGEFKDLLAGFDSAFLGIFPDFVEKVNEHMQKEHQLIMPAKGELSTELRILALIRMGISKRTKIAKVLNMSSATVYSYHCNLQKHSLHPDTSFDKIIANL